MKNFLIFFLILFSLSNLLNAKENLASVDSLFHIDQMNSHDENFALYFKTREKAVLARGETSNYINDFQMDLSFYNYKKKESLPMISDDWFATTAQYFLT